MKLKNVEIKLGIFRYLLFLPFLLFTFCESIEVDFTPDAVLTKDSKVITLMMAAINSGSDINFTKSGNNDQCTEFLYPITFLLYEEIPKPITINSDAELDDFINSLKATDNFTMYFPITLLDVDGEPTILSDLTALEGTLEMALDACTGNKDDNGDDDINTLDDNGSDDNNTGDNSGNDNGDDYNNTGDDTGNDDSPWDFCHENNKKVYICHKGQTICVSINAIWGHTNQHEEDYLGQCE